MTTDVRYYAITLGGRMKLDADSDTNARIEVESSRYLKATTKQIVRETREVIFEQTPSGTVG